MRIRKTICDRCGEQISGNPVHISVYGDKGIARKYGETLRKSDFCTECIEFIADFALNKDACDECMREMEENTAMMQTSDEEEGAGPNMDKYKDVRAAYYGEPIPRVDGKEGSDSLEEPDPDSLDWSEALSRMEKSSSIDESPY